VSPVADVAAGDHEDAGAAVVHGRGIARGLGDVGLDDFEDEEAVAGDLA